MPGRKANTIKIGKTKIGLEIFTLIEFHFTTVHGFTQQNGHKDFNFRPYAARVYAQLSFQVK